MRQPYPPVQVTHEHWKAKALKTEKQARAECRPFVIKWALAWAITSVLALVMGFFAWQAFEAITTMPTYAALLFAVVIQGGAIGAFHWWFGCRHNGITDWRLGVARGAAIFCAGILIGVAITRFWGLSEEFDMPVPLRFLFIPVISLLDPVLSLLAGAWTSGAQHAKSFAKAVVKLAHQYRTQIEDAVDDEATWQVSMRHARESLREVEHEKERTLPDDKLGREVLEERIKRIWRPWIQKLELAHPVPDPGSPPPDESTWYSTRIVPQER